ncbi:glycosyltransferase family 43 protein [Cystobasidium minutum MCA 4210]|uniref:glycosyltransferase family 43 protein n=1 Tax=Cystobasidium minutum MCA 4210 TaxID=1397322 RepID=UPI0034D01F98|eukprot:jgi/Rhomi1/209159/estExt_Genemark1.C_2_t20471
MGQRHKRARIFALATIAFLCLACEVFRRAVGSPDFAASYLGPRFSELLPLQHERQSFLTDSKKHGKNRNDGTICPTCNCSQPGSYLLSPYIGQQPHLKLLHSPQATKRDYARYLSHHLFVQARNDPVPVPDASRIALSDRFNSCPDALLSFSFSKLKPNLPTAYAFTRTSSHGRLGALDKRLRYFARHADTIKEYYQLVEKEGYADGKSAKDRQFLWMVIEDDDHINPDLAKWLEASEIPYLYVAHGPTRWYGLAQWNLAYSIAIFLRDTLLGDGPVVSVDDDGMVKPEMFRRIWAVKKVITWQVGNFHTIDHPGSTWEGPFTEKGKLVRWHNSWSWGPNRTFPLDMGGFAVNSAVLGPGRFLPGPRFIPDKPYDSEDTSNENEFLLQFYQRQEDMEFACYDSKEEKCYWTWHNHWLPEDIDAAHKPPLGPDYE